MLDTRDDVKRFMIAGDQVDVGYGKQSTLYMNLITEEVVHETIKEVDSDNIIGIADGIADSIWVINGFIHTLELDYKDIWKKTNEYMQLNLPLNITAQLDNQVLDSYLVLRKSYRYYDHNDRYIFEGRIKNLIISLLELSKSYNLPMQAIWNEISRSNFSKVSENGKIMKNENGKIMKPGHFSPADIKQVLIDYEII